MIDVGNPEAASRAKTSNEVNVAAILRENEHLRAVAEAAIRLRAAGRSYDKIAEGVRELQDASPQMPRSATPLIMANEAFETAMRDFDEAVLRAAAEGMEWAPLPPLGPREVAKP